MIWEYMVSGLVNFLIIAIIAGMVDNEMYNSIEKHQMLGAFLVFVIPAMLEICSHFLTHQPFLWNLM